MLKLISVDSALFHDEPIARLLTDFKTPGLVKQAATDDRIAAYAANIEPHPDRVYVHFVAMGAMEYWGFNRNADAFPEANLLRCYKTFETNPAHVFRHHINKDKNIAMGQVTLAIYNERMHRVELVAWIDKKRGADVIARIERGDFPASSMACKTPYDICSICGNKAHTRAEYCRHLGNELGKILPDGRKVGALNEGPLSFFDISIVVRPADVTSSVLQKLAEENEVPEMTIGSAEQAEMDGLMDKASSIKKLSELVKEVEGEITGSADSINALLDKIKDPDDEILDFLEHYDIHTVVHAFAELGISPSVSFFAKLIGQKIAGEHAPCIEHLVNGLMKAEPESVEVETDLSSMYKSASYPRATILAKLAPLAKHASLYPDMMMQRAFDLSDYKGPPQGPMGMIGFAGQGPALSVDPADTYRALKASIAEESPGLLKTLFRVAGLAIAAKWLTSKLIEAKMQEVLARQQQLELSRASYAKIGVIKSAQEAITTQKLVKQDLLRSLKI